MWTEHSVAFKGVLLTYGIESMKLFSRNGSTETNYVIHDCATLDYSGSIVYKFPVHFILYLYGFVN